MLGRFIQRSSAPIGVDIGSSGVKMLQLRMKGFTPEVSAAAEFDRDDYAGEMPLTPKMLANIKGRVESGEFSGRECVLTFPDHWLTTRSVRLPVMPEQETNAALEFGAAERLGFDDDTNPGQVSWVRAGRVRQGDETRDEIILVGVERGPLTELVT